MVSSRKASKSAELTQTLALIGVSLNAELRLSVSYIPGVNVDFGSSSGADVCAPAAETNARKTHADATSRCLAGTGSSFGLRVNICLVEASGENVQHAITPPHPCGTLAARF